MPVMAIFLILTMSCNNNQPDENLAPNVHKVKAEEIIQTSMYTYVRVSSSDSEYWLAINKANIIEGNTYYWSVGDEMNEFTSKELKRTFRSIFFVQDFTDKPITKNMTMQPKGMPGAMAGKQAAEEKNGISVEKAPGGMTIAELFAGSKDLGGKKVKIRGEVVKFLSGIMGMNWVHLQDGTKNGDNFDITITTDDIVTVGSVVIAEGTVVLNKDFGAGYSYDVIIENATFSIEK